MTTLEILEAHTLEWVADDVGNYECACGFYPDPFNGTDVSIEDQHRAHLAEVLEKHMREHARMWQEHAYEVGYVQACEDIENGADGPTIPNPYRKETRDGR